MSASRFTALGIDVGGTKTALGLVSFPEGVVHAHRTIPTSPGRGAAAVLAEIERLAAALAASHPVDAIGLGVCELVSQTGGIVSANCLDWTGASVRARLSAIAPTLVEADVRAAALAEALFGAGRNAPVFLYVSIGTGIASCLVIDGRPFTGSRGAAGTMASGPLPQFVSTPPAPPSITLEQVASGPALVARFNSLGGMAGHAQDVLAAAATGGHNANLVLGSAAEALGGSLGWLVNVLDPEMVILGGGLGSAEGPFRDRLVAAARRHIWWDGHRNLPFVSAGTGPAAGVIGAAAAAWQHFRDT